VKLKTGAKLNSFYGGQVSLPKIPFADQTLFA
jgi:hypothetical protein